MAANSVAICNSALSKLGVTNITALSDTSRQAVLCNEQYNKIRKYLLGKYYWDFAIGRSELTDSGVTPDFEYTYYHELPIDFLRTYYMYNNVDSWVVEGQYIASNSETIQLVYVKDIEDTEEFTVLFDEVLALMLAKEMCYPLVQSITKEQEIDVQLKQELRDVRTIDSMQGTPVDPNDDVWLNARIQPTGHSKAFGPYRSYP